MSSRDTGAARDRLWEAVLDGDEYSAVSVVFEAVDAGITPEDALLEVVAPVQRKVGTEWAANRITVAQEHAATAINDRVIAALSQHPASRTHAAAGRVTVACVDGEWHALPARLLGADAWAQDARAAVQCLSDDLARLRLTATASSGALPHLEDQEYSMVSGTKAQLVKSTVAELENRFPAMRDYSVAQREHTTEDIAHIIDFLATALYVDDDDLFTTFIVWTAEVLEARGVPATSLIPALDLLSDQLQDFPRTQRLLTAARTALTAKTTSPIA